jgi:hypothetical protein
MSGYIHVVFSNDLHWEQWLLRFESVCKDNRVSIDEAARLRHDATLHDVSDWVAMDEINVVLMKAFKIAGIHHSSFTPKECLWD